MSNITATVRSTLTKSRKQGSASNHNPAARCRRYNIKRPAGANKIVAVPIGFLCDNVEVLYDLGIEGRNKARQLGVQFSAANAVNTHPAFIKLLADQVEAKL